MSPLYQCWQGMRNRCLNPKTRNFKNYGGRGIRIAPEWADDFHAFWLYVIQNLGPRPEGRSIDRIDELRIFGEEGRDPLLAHGVTVTSGVTGRTLRLATLASQPPGKTSVVPVARRRPE